MAYFHILALLKYGENHNHDCLGGGFVSINITVV